MARICTLAERRATRCLHECAASIPSQASSALQQDEESLHALRVACRRSRVALAEFGGQLAPGPRRDAKTALREIRHRLGIVRELDANLAVLKEFAPNHPDAAEYARNRLERERIAAWEAMGDPGRELGADRLSATLLALEDAYRRTTDCYRKQAEQRLKKRLKQLNRQYRTWRETQRADDLHDLRIRFKKMRYTLEVYVDLYGKDGKSALRDLESAQDALGEWNDHRVLNRHLRGFEPDVEAPLDSAYAALLCDSDAAIERKLEGVAAQTAEFFTKQQVRALKKLFGEPQRPCCDKER